MSYYQVDYHCTNCGTLTIRSFPYGTLAPEITVCVSCGCSTARKSQGASQVKTPSWEVR